ncbi:MAG TPA: aldo/keto reductase [Steroidobacteraceae bacterium]|nr:aldo/keto reductase [Steroidobacteraceae bacterium]
MQRHITRRQAIGGVAAAAAWLGGCASTRSAETALISRPIPATGERLPVIGVGTNNFGVEAPAALAARRAVLAQLPQLGGSVVDTAPLYGRAEGVIGDLVAALGNRSQLFLATKVIAFSAAAGRDSMEQSLAKLRTARIDLMQVHNLIGVEAMLPVLQQWKRAGRIRYLGITTSSAAQHPRMMAYMQRYPLDFIQVDYSLGNRVAAAQVLPLAQARGIAVIANTPFGGRRAAAGVFARVAGRPLPGWAADIGVTTWSQFFLKYVVSHPAVTCTVPGTTEPAHLADNQHAGRGRLPDAAMRTRMEALWESLPG